MIPSMANCISASLIAHTERVQGYWKGETFIHAGVRLSGAELALGSPTLLVLSKGSPVNSSVPPSVTFDGTLVCH